ncbi:MAG TPA: TdeIII family type II restriction endonuclease [Balneola sp.]|jgi:hypothetical protein|nr:restriction endonuclease [Balneola sp.]MAO78612.1 restriction endonuclease [Balneola sp.]MBF63159.1 restriction endonuclease [Balneola sp.]HAH51255.1 TdeIII family type II restriction endonuclease [Balneola sp.]HBZ38404.1 TdeIII family type II restriction endonuclease [Balneola sp.]|tara:strand:+ start:15679 stop:16725 length:1047 start_codon:yes stop_codon:yes gene_type:complete
MDNQIKEKISIEVIKTLVSRFETFPEDASNNRNAPFHEAFLNAFTDEFGDRVSDIPFFISLSSWMHGLNTTLGQTFFENIAQLLSDGEKREYTSKKLGNLPILKTQKDSINDLMTDLSNSIVKPNLENEDKKINIDDKSEEVDAIDFSADVYFEDENEVVAIELKSVKPNSGEMRGEKRKILEGKAAFFKKYGDSKSIRFLIGFPFDPTSEESTASNKEKFLGSIINMNKFFHIDETLVANELWDYLSGEENTMENILEIINQISTTDFMTKYKILNNGVSKTSKDYTDILKSWNLYSELELSENYELLEKNIEGDKRLIKWLNKNCFDNKGAYRFDRYNLLVDYIEN